MQVRVEFEHPFPGAQSLAFLDDDEVTFELIDCSTEVCGSGRTEYWGQSTHEKWTKHLVNEATVVAVNGDRYDSIQHGLEEQILRRCDFVVDDSFYGDSFYG